MRLKIDASGLLQRRYLKITKTGVKFLEGGMLWGARSFNFGEIQYVLMSNANQLSFQVGNEVFAIQTNPLKLSDEATIQALMSGVERSRERASSPAHYSASP